MIVVILGMHRSGTSILGKLLSNLGVDMGDISQDSYMSNIEGHFEDKLILDINEKILNELKSTWYCPPSNKLVNEKSGYIKELYSEYIRSLEDKHSRGIKEPRLSLFAQQFNDVVDGDVKYIYITRDKYEVAKSLKVRNDFNIDDSIALKALYDKRITEFLVGKDFLKLDYHSLVNNSETTLEMICKYLEFDIDYNAISHIKKPEEIRTIKYRLIKKSLKRHLFKVLNNPKHLLSRKTIVVLKGYVNRFRELLTK